MKKKSKIGGRNLYAISAHFRNSAGPMNTKTKQTNKELEKDIVEELAEMEDEKKVK